MEQPGPVLPVALTLGWTLGERFERAVHGRHDLVRARGPVRQLGERTGGLGVGGVGLDALGQQIASHVPDEVAVQRRAVGNEQLALERQDMAAGFKLDPLDVIGTLRVKEARARADRHEQPITNDDGATDETVGPAERARPGGLALEGLDRNGRDLLATNSKQPSPDARKRVYVPERGRGAGSQQPAGLERDTVDLGLVRFAHAQRVAIDERRAAGPGRLDHVPVARRPFPPAQPPQAPGVGFHRGEHAEFIGAVDHAVMQRGRRGDERPRSVRQGADARDEPQPAGLTRKQIQPDEIRGAGALRRDVLAGAEDDGGAVGHGRAACGGEIELRIEPSRDGGRPGDVARFRIDRVDPSVTIAPALVRDAGHGEQVRVGP